MEENTATIVKNEISVRHASHPEINYEFLTVHCDGGWDEVKKLTNKVLTFKGRKFTWSGWNSDKNDCYFVRLLNGPAPSIARIS